MPVDKNLKNLIDPPSGVLDNDRPWYTAKVGDGTWNLLKLKLTGKRDSHGGSYSSTVNLSDADADKLIATMKTDPRGYPQMDDGGGGRKFFDIYPKFQAWLVEQYLGKKVENIPEEVGMVDEPEPPKAAISLYEGVGEEDIVEEEVDGDIVTILGLDDVSDFNYGDYKTLLKEKLIASRVDTGSLSAEEDEKIREEFSRVKGKVGKFKLKKRVITAESFVDSSFGSQNSPVTSPSRMLPGSGIFNSGKPGSDDFLGLNQSVEVVSDINTKLDDIIETLKDQAEISKDFLEFDRKQDEKEKRDKKEGLLEKSKKIIGKIKDVVIQPIQSMWEKVWNFLKNVIIGHILTKIFKWWNDPKNKSTIDGVFKFLEVTWPAILAAWVLFGTKIGRFSRVILRQVAKWGTRFLKWVAMNPATAILAGTTIAAGYGATKLMGESEENSDAAVKAAEEKKGKPLTKKEKEKAVADNMMNQGAAHPGVGVLGSTLIQQQVNSLKKEEENKDKGDKPQKKENGKIFGFIPVPEQGSLTSYNGGGLVLPPIDITLPGRTQNFNGGGLVNRSFQTLKYNQGGYVDNSLINQVQNFSEGGGVSGPGGIDKVPAMLTDGEFVMSTGAVSKYGAGTLAAMNSAGGGNNKPTVTNQTVYAKGGGLISSSPIQNFNEGGFVNNIVTLAPIQNFNEGGFVNTTTNTNTTVPVQKFNEGGFVNNISNVNNTITNTTSPIQNFNEGGFVTNISPILNFSQGGGVSGPGGIDKVPAMLTSGEFVMSKGAVNKFGSDTMASINAAGGGNNKPKVSRGRVHAAQGGEIGPSTDGEVDLSLFSGESRHDSEPHTPEPGIIGKENDKKSGGGSSGSKPSTKPRKSSFDEMGFASLLDDFVDDLLPFISAGKSIDLSGDSIKLGKNLFGKSESVIEPTTGMGGILGKFISGISDLFGGTKSKGKSKKGSRSIIDIIGNFASDPIGNFAGLFDGGKKESPESWSSSPGSSGFDYSKDTSKIKTSFGEFGSFDFSKFLNIDYGQGKSEVEKLSPEDKNVMIWAKSNRKMIESFGTPDQKEILTRADKLDPDNKIFLIPSPQVSVSSPRPSSPVVSPAAPPPVVSPSPPKSSEFVDQLLLSAGVEQSPDEKLIKIMEKSSPSSPFLAHMKEQKQLKPIPGIHPGFNRGGGGFNVSNITLPPAGSGSSAGSGGSSQVASSNSSSPDIAKMLRLGILS